MEVRITPRENNRCDPPSALSKTRTRYTTKIASPGPYANKADIDAIIFQGGAKFNDWVNAGTPPINLPSMRLPERRIRSPARIMARMSPRIRLAIRLFGSSGVGCITFIRRNKKTAGRSINN